MNSEMSTWQEITTSMQRLSRYDDHEDNDKLMTTDPRKHILLDVQPSLWTVTMDDWVYTCKAINSTQCGTSNRLQHQGQHKQLNYSLHYRTNNGKHLNSLTKLAKQNDTFVQTKHVKLAERVHIYTRLQTQNAKRLILYISVYDYGQISLFLGQSHSTCNIR